MHLPVYCSTPDWNISGVNTFLTHVIRQVVNNGSESRLLFTGEAGGDAKLRMPFPRDVPVEKLGVRWYDSKRAQWSRLKRFLVQNAPCIFLPGYDWYCSYMSATLPPSVRVVGVLHSDEEVYYEWAERVGSHFDRIVAVSNAIAEHLVERRPDLQERVSAIPYGIQPPNDLPVRVRQPGDPLRIVYVGRVLQYQKRVFDLPYIVDALDAMGVPVQLTVVGAGPDFDIWKQVANPWIERGLIRCEPTVANDEVGRLLCKNDVFLLASEFEGLPLALLEALAHGCVPVVSDIRSGIPEVIQHGVNGFRVPVGAIQTFAQRLAELYHRPELLSQMSKNARQTITQGKLCVEDMGQQYINLFRKFSGTKMSECLRIAPQQVELPPELRVSRAEYLPGQVRRAGIIGMHLCTQFVRAA